MSVSDKQRQWLTQLRGRDQAQLLKLWLTLLPPGVEQQEFLKHIRPYFPGTDLWFDAIVAEFNAEKT